MLDLLHKDVVEAYFPSENTKNFSRKQIINLVPKLDIPFGSLDMRAEKSISSERKYSDLFVRNLSTRLWTKRKFREGKFFFRRNGMRIARVFVTILLIFLPMIFFMKFSVESGYNKLLSLAKAENFSEMKKLTHSAKTDFERAEFLFLPFSWLPFDIVDTAHRATIGGKNVATSLDALFGIFGETNENFSLKIVENGENNAFRGASKDIFPTENLGISLPTNHLASKKSEIFSAIENLENASEIYKNAHGNNAYAEKMRKVGKILGKIMPALALYRDSHDEILTMLGHNSPERYMIFNQNRDEIRANGGFPGSIISFTLYKGNVLDYRTDDVYYYDWNLYPHKETPPAGIALLTDNYGLRDVNYYPDFRDTLEKANRFVERSGDSTLTTAIAIHQGLVEEILAVIGEVKVDGVDVAFTDKNFSILMSMLVENKFAKEKTPKDILFRFVDAFVHKVFESKKIEEIADIIENNWRRGEIVMASRNEKVQDFLTLLQNPLPWKSNEKNWIYPIFTSISGNKSDRYISRTIETKTKNLENCRYETTATLTHEHLHSQSDAEILENFMQTFELKDETEQEKMRFIQGAGQNKSFVRLYLPKGAILSGS